MAKVIRTWWDSGAHEDALSGPSCSSCSMQGFISSPCSMAARTGSTSSASPTRCNGLSPSTLSASLLCDARHASQVLDFPENWLSNSPFLRLLMQIFGRHLKAA